MSIYNHLASLMTIIKKYTLKSTNIYQKEVLMLVIIGSIENLIKLILMSDSS